MPRVVYRPNHPQANVNGMVPIELAYEGAGPVGIGLHVISDEMEPTRHMADNKFYTSKHKFRETTRAYGCVEVGTDPAISRPRKPIPLSREKRREDIRRTLYNLRNGIRD